MNQNINPTIGTSRIRHLRGAGIVIQERREDREQFDAILIQLRFLATRASGETAEYYRRNLIQQADRMCEKNLAEVVEVGV
jgi:hypothetical protein